MKSLMALMLVCCSFVRAQDYKCDDERVRGQPVVTLLASCDENRSGELFQPCVVRDTSRKQLRVAANEVLLFQVIADYVDEQGTVVHDRMYFVLGGYEGQPGEATVNGRLIDPEEDASIITLSQGWLWVGSELPAGTVSKIARGAEASFTQLPEAAGDPQARAIDWITWSILELIRARWSWAGAEATEFIVRFDRKRDLIKSEQKVYPIEAGSAIHHSFRHGGGKGRVKAKPSDGVFTKAVGRGAASQHPIIESPSDQRFLAYARCRVSQLVRDPGSDCAIHEGDCDRQREQTQKP